MPAVTPSVYLASRSPRRQQLLDQIGITYQVVPVDVTERRRPGEHAEEYVRRAALDKALAGLAAGERELNLPVLGADTAVVVDDDVLGKPRDKTHGLEMLARLSNRAHRVLSAVALVAPGRAEVRLSISEVDFRMIPGEEREAYWATGEPVDKAGAYAIQGRGAVFVSNLCGSYSAVMGLPLFETAELLAEFGVSVF